MIFLLFTLAQGSVFLGDLKSGSSCPDTGIVYINSYTVTPYPVNRCTNQSVLMIGTFNRTFCVDQILVHQIYNQRETNDQLVPVSQCFNKAQQVNFNFQVVPFKCDRGNYTIETSILSHPITVTLGCWQYSYTIS